MALDLVEFGNKLKRYREQLKLAVSEVAASTGIKEPNLIDLEAGNKKPSGDEVLILADFYKCDYRFFISNERLAPFEQTQSLYRRFGTEFSKEDRWRIQEFLFLCECEQFLMEALNRKYLKFTFVPQGTYFKGHGASAAASLRKLLGYKANAVAGDVYGDFRKIGLHIFRRQLDNSNISGVMIRHPYAGACVLVNYAEDIYRQRFTAAHETAHSILDQDEFIVSFTKWDRNNLVEIRANTFASSYLLPPSLLETLPQTKWDHESLVNWASRLKVSALTLAIGLKENGSMSEEVFSSLASVRVPAHLKSDPELANLEGRSLERKRSLLERGLSASYVALCFDALTEGVITNARAAEMLLISEDELVEMSRLFHINLFAHD